MTDFELSIRQQYRQAQAGEAEYPEVLYFQHREPRTVRESGLYVNYDDFTDVIPDLRIAGEPVTALYHSLVLHFSRRVSSEFYNHAHGELLYNYANHSRWNRSATTYRYWLLGATLLPYAATKVDVEHKIHGLGEKGRMVMRAVLLEEIENEAIVLGEDKEITG
ncbi:MAG: hypothetical protein M3Q14_00050 [bacterium]|nr:hypothetical protein [bacterium]